MNFNNGIKTRVYRVTEENFEAVLEEAAEILKNGGTVAFPTETVYGLGANGLSPAAVKKIFEAKNRPADNPLSLLIHSKETLSLIVRQVPEKAIKLMDAFWPGPLTLVLEKTEAVPPITSGGLSSIGVRMPAHRVALELIKRAGVPLAAPSANLSGRPSPSKAEHVISDLSGRVDAIIDGGAVDIGLESTVIDMTSKVPEVLRPGAIGIEEIEKLIGPIRVGSEKKPLPKEAGRKYGHYSPKTRVILVEGTGTAVACELGRLAAAFQKEGKKVGLLITEETAAFFSQEGISADGQALLGKRDKPGEAAYLLFTGLRALDKLGLDIILADGSLTKKGVGEAVLNRLEEAASRLMES